MEIVTSSPQYRELMKALAEAKKQLGPEEWQEISQTVINDVDTFVARRLGELSEGEPTRPIVPIIAIGRNITDTKAKPPGPRIPDPASTHALDFPMPARVRRRCSVTTTE